MRNKEQYIFTLKTAYQIPDNLIHLPWKLWPQQTVFPVNSLLARDNQGIHPSTTSFWWTKIRQLRYKVKEYEEGVGREDRMRRNGGWGRAHHPTKLEGTYSLCHYSERAHLKTHGTLSLGTLVFEEGPDELSGSLTMLDLWLSAKSKLRGIGERGGGRKPCRPDLISTLPRALFTIITYLQHGITKPHILPSLPLSGSRLLLPCSSGEREMFLKC